MFFSLLSSQAVADRNNCVCDGGGGALLIVRVGQVGNTIRSGRQFHGDCGHGHIVKRPQRRGRRSHREFSLLHLGHDGRRHDPADGQCRRLGRIPRMKRSLARPFHRKQSGVDARAAALCRLHASLYKAVTRGKLTDTAREEILTRIWPTDSIAAGVAGADLVIEARPGTHGPQAGPCSPSWMRPAGLMRSWPPTPPRCRSPRSRAARSIRPGWRGCTSSIPRRS